MTRDASLSEFGGTDDGDESDGSDGNGIGGNGSGGSDGNKIDGNGSGEPGIDDGDDGNGSGEGQNGGDTRAEPAVSTYAWGETYACSACGSAVERAWRDDGDLVCERCKTW